MNYEKQMQEKGYLLIRNCISKQDSVEYKQIIKSYFQKSKHKTVSDGTAKPNAFNEKELFGLHSLFENKKLISILNRLTYNNLMFLDHSDIHYNFKAYGWHDDTQVRCLPSPPLNYSLIEEDVSLTDKPYQCYTVAIYLQNYEEGGGLTIMEGSHKNGIGSDVSGRKIVHSQKTIDLKTNLGDVIIFDARLFHHGKHGIKNDRASIFFRMGAANNHGLYHSRGAINRQNCENRQMYQMTDRLREVLNKNNIKTTETI